jgi:hypothetical protein
VGGLGMEETVKKEAIIILVCGTEYNRQVRPTDGGEPLSRNIRFL